MDLVKNNFQISWLIIIVESAIWEKVFYFLACDQNFISTTNIKSKNGTFLAPNFLNPEGHVRQCTYNFRALPGNNHWIFYFYFQILTGERVQVMFEEFSLEGTPPEWVATDLCANCFFLGVGLTDLVDETFDQVGITKTLTKTNANVFYFSKMEDRNEYIKYIITCARHGQTGGAIES